MTMKYSRRFPQTFTAQASPPRAGSPTAPPSRRPQALLAIYRSARLKPKYPHTLGSWGFCDVYSWLKELVSRTCFRLELQLLWKNLFLNPRRMAVLLSIYRQLEGPPGPRAALSRTRGLPRDSIAQQHVPPTLFVLVKKNKTEKEKSRSVQG